MVSASDEQKIQGSTSNLNHLCRNSPTGQTAETFLKWVSFTLGATGYEG